MAEGHPAHRDPSGWPVTKLFTAFRIALDLKKLALAAAGIFATYLGWWVLSAVFYTSAPQWKVYEKEYSSQKQAWDAFSRDRARWRLLHELAAPPTVGREEAADIARSAEEFTDLEGVVEGRKPVRIDVAAMKLIVGGATEYKFSLTNAVKPVAPANDEAAKPAEAAYQAELDKLKAIGAVPFADLIVNEKDSTVTIDGKTLRIDSEFESLRYNRSRVKPLALLSEESRILYNQALVNPRVKPAGRFRVCPWNEYRGPNPFLLVMNVVHGSDVPFSRERGGFTSWLLHDQLPVLLEPIVKFLSPIYYLFKPEAGGWRNWTYLVLIILWNLAVWGYFGGIICRLSAVQFARNEKIPLSEAIDFVNTRAKHFFLAPLFPLICLFGLAFLLGAFGFVTGWTYFFGDIVVAGLLWPLVIIMGLVMAVLLVGLFAWPLMYPTIAIEGSDSFDALSRSYSYLYQAPWQFLSYVGMALLYGAALVFFVGFMASLTVYLGKWGFNKAPFISSENAKSDRTSVYLFANAPTSFGWRDLFLQDSEWARPVEAIPGSTPVHYELRKDYVDAISWSNRIGGWLVTLWLSLLFLLVVGFGYSYFWTASTIVYFLMRKKVDDTDFDEIYLDEDEIPPPPPPAPAPPKEAPVAPKPGTLSLNVVEPPKPPPGV